MSNDEYGREGWGRSCAVCGAKNAEHQPRGDYFECERCFSQDREDMEFSVTRNQLAVIYAQRFACGLAMAQYTDAHAPATLPMLEALWEPFLDTVYDLGLIDQDAREEWTNAGCPKRHLLTAMVNAMGDGPSIEFGDELE